MGKQSRSMSKGQYSYQDMEQRIRGLENALTFVMTSFSVDNAATPFAPKKNLLDVYRDVTSGKTLQQAVGSPEPVTPPVDLPVDPPVAVEMDPADGVTASA